jgi:hypothetical protein
MSKKPSKPKPGYLERIISQALTNGVKAGVQHVIVEHEQNCPMLKGGKRCTCEPEITFTEGSA